LSWLVFTLGKICIDHQLTLARINCLYLSVYMYHLHHFIVSFFKVQKYILIVSICICYMYLLQPINCMYKLLKSEFTLACTSGLIYIYIGHVSLDIVGENKEKRGEWGWEHTSNAAFPSCYTGWAGFIWYSYLSLIFLLLFKMYRVRILHWSCCLLVVYLSF